MDDDDSSFIGCRLRQTGDLLLGGAQKQVGDYRSKFEGLKGTYDDFLSQLLVSYSGAKFDPSFVDDFFGKTESVSKKKGSRDNPEQTKLS
jgi:hypothetical protein